MKFFSIVHHLFEGKGHELPYQLSLSEAVFNNGWKFIPIISPDPVINKFPDTWNSKIFADHGVLDKNGKVIISNLKKFRIKIFINAITNLYKSFLKIFNTEIHSEAIIFFESFNPLQLLSLLLATQFSKNKKYISLWLLFRGGPNWGGGNYKLISYGFSYSFKILLFIFSKLNKNINIKYFTDSEILVRELTVFYKKEVKILPIPHTKISFKKNILINNNNNLIKIWWPGVPRIEKGSQVINDFISNSNLYTDKFELLFSDSNLIDLKNAKIKYRLLKNNMDTSEYYGLFNEIDIILLPYNRDIYNESTSGIFTEAIFSSKLTMVTAGTWMSSEYERFNIFNLSYEWNNISIEEEIVKIINDDSLKSKLKIMSEEYQKFHSVKNFSKYLNDYFLNH